MYKFIAIIIWIALVVIPFIKPLIFQSSNQSYDSYVRGLKESFILSWVGFKLEGVEDSGEAFGFIVSLLLYIIISLVVSFLWIVLLPLFLLILITKKTLKKEIT